MGYSLTRIEGTAKNPYEFSQKVSALNLGKWHHIEQFSKTYFAACYLLHDPIEDISFRVGNLTMFMKQDNFKHDFPNLDEEYVDLDLESALFDKENVSIV